MSHKKTSLANALSQLGRQESGSGRSVNLPLMQGSTLLFDSLADFEAARDSRYRPDVLYYGRYGNPASFQLENMLAELEGAEHCISVSSGLTAVTMALLAATQAGSHVLVADNVYAPTRLFCDTVLARFGVEVTYFDPMLGARLAGMLQSDTAAVMFEAPGTATFEVPDIPAIAKVARDHGAISILDGTWATPVFCRPIKLGVDIVAHSGSKYIGGHSDTMIGFIVCNAAHYLSMRKMVLAFGDRAGAHDIFLSLRGLRTLEIRMKHVEAAALKIATWLSEQPQVKKVLHPAFPDCPGHEFWSRDFRGSSGIFSVLFDCADKNKLHRFIDGLKMFGLGVSWGGFESLALPFDPAAMRTATAWGETGQLVRISIGFEDTDDLIADLAQALKCFN
ncbi:MAG: cystathionine beta-lyase [Gammaproteobacteria bacterium]|nr:cystathionine beta-lyase [Gammaproteobacteria bacterium]